ncbi:unnamed protein product [Calicophoron daubneyi]|uniref:Mitotic spindle assembly checkpoint protein MAD1 n=1 Tax=Calicophoron daubneyi TaxID=300641 RepID=A0AAV2SY92_CALDB
MLQRTRGSLVVINPNEVLSNSKLAVVSAQKRSAEWALSSLHSDHEQEIKQLKLEKDELQMTKAGLVEDLNVLKVRADLLEQEKKAANLKLNEVEQTAVDRVDKVVKACNSLEESLNSEVEQLRNQEMENAQKILELERAKSERDARVSELEARLQARVERLKELETFFAEKKAELDDVVNMKRTISELKDENIKLTDRLQLQENRTILPAKFDMSGKGAAHVVKLEMELDRLRVAYKTLSKERAGWLITKEENNDLRNEVERLKQWRQRALIAENALSENKNELPTTSPLIPGLHMSDFSPARTAQLQRENELLLAEQGELSGRVNELQTTVEELTSQVQCLTEQNNKLTKQLSSSNAVCDYQKADLSSTIIRRTPVTELESERQVLVDLRHRITELEEHLRSSEEERQILSERLESLNMKGEFDPKTTKVLTLKGNPAAQVGENLFNEVTYLRRENATLRQRIKVLEDCVVRLREKKSESDSLIGDESTVGSVTMVVNDRLKDNPDPLTELASVREQLRVERLRGDRMMEMFDKASSKFRHTCRELFGYRISMESAEDVKVLSMLDQDPAGCLLFKRTDGKYVLKETDYVRALPDNVRSLLDQSLPGFFATLTLHQLNQMTMLA